jgi:tetratricopeptide (TPR) repeat protein
MFLFLALVFALGFVGFGVGAGGVGVGDVLRDAAGGSGTPSISDSEQTAGNTDSAIEAMQSYIALRPKDEDAIRELAALYLQQASAAQERAQIYQIRSDYLAPGAIRDTVFQLGGSPLVPDPITNAVSTAYEREITAAASEIQTASAQAVEMYRKITQLHPNDPTVQLELAQAAQSANDITTVIAAYEAYLKLAPDDPTAPEVRRILRQYQRFGQSG